MNRTITISLISATVLFAAAAGHAEPRQELPKGLKGFSGQVRGVIVEKGERNTFTFKVGRVLRVWKNNKAETPHALINRTIPVGPRWQKNESGKWHPVELHVAFIRKLKAGQEITLEIHNVEASHFNILELSHEQRQLARGEGSEREGAAARKTEAQIEELRAEVKRLRAEIAELRRLIKQRER